MSDIQQKQKDLARIHDLANEYGVDIDIVFALYDTMPNELYDGIVTILEDVVSNSEVAEYMGLR